MKFARYLIFCTAILSGCNATEDNDFSQVAVISEVCRANPDYKLFSLNLNLCKQESFNESGFKTCISRAVQDRDVLPANCKAETADLLAQATGFFLDKVLKEDAQKESLGLEERAQKSASYMNHWLTKLPSDLNYPVVEGLFNKVYLKTSENLTKLVLDRPDTLNQESIQVFRSNLFFDAAKASGSLQGFNELSLVYGAYDLLRAIEPRLKLVLKLRQMQCAMGSCKLPQSEEYAFLSKLNDLASLQSSGKLVFSSGGPMGSALNLISQNHDLLIAAIKKNRERFGFDPNLEVPASKELQASRMLDLSSLLASYVTSFEELRNVSQSRSDSHATIRYGLSKGSLETIVDFLVNQSAQISQLSSAYMAERARLVSLIKQNLDNKKQIETLRVEQKLEYVQLDRLASEIRELRNSFLKADEEFANLQGKFNRLKLTTDAVDSLWISKNLKENLRVIPKMAKYRVGTGFSASELAFESVDLKAGEALFLRVDGEWGPTCALKKEMPDLIAGQLSTGPNGYVVAMSQGKSQVHSREKYSSREDYVDFSDTNSACKHTTGGINGQLGANKSNGAASGGFGAGGGVTGDVSECGGYTSGTRSADGTRESFSTSEQISNNVNIQGGLTLKNTPFQKLPVGAVIALVQTVSGKQSFHVLNRATRIESAEDYKVLLIVNDCDEQPSDETQGLDLDVFKLTNSSDSIGKALLKAQDSIEEMKEKAYSLLKNGSDVDAEMSALAKATRAEIFSESGQIFNKSAVASEYLDSLLQHAVAQLSRKAKILSRGIAYDSGMERYYSSLRQEKLGAAEKDLIHMEVNEALSEMSIAGVGPLAFQVSDNIIADVLPVIYFHTDKKAVLDALRVEFADFETNLSLSSDTGKMLESYAKILNALALHVKSGQNLLRYKRQMDDLLIKVPNPDLISSETLQHGGPQLNPKASLALWQNFFTKEASDLSKVIFRLSPDEVYGDQFAEGGITCNSTKPVIEDIAFALVLKDKSLDLQALRNHSRNKEFALRIGPSFSFVDKSGPVTLNVSAPEEGISNARFGFVRSDSYSDAYDLLKNPGESNFARAGQGLSPFSEWSINANTLKSFVRLQGGLFYKDKSKGVLMEGTFVPDSVGAALKDDFAAINSPVEFVNVETFPKGVSDILILVRFSSLTADFESHLNWVKGCAPIR